MPPPHATTAMESIALTFLLLVASACISLFCTSHNRRRNSRVGLMSLQLQQPEEPPKLQSGFADSLRVATTTTTTAAHGGRDVDYHLAFNMSEQDFSPTPVFNDRQFERIFRLTKTIVEHPIRICAKTEPFFTDIQDVSGRYCIAPVAKVLMALKLLAYGCSPSGFLDYFQMSELTARHSLNK